MKDLDYYTYCRSHKIKANNETKYKQLLNDIAKEEEIDNIYEQLIKQIDKVLE